MKICKNCKTSNDDWAKCCRSCGRLLDMQEESQSSNSGNTVKVVVRLLCFIGMIGSIIAFGNGAPKYPTIWITVACGAGLSWAVGN